MGMEKSTHTAPGKARLGKTWEDLIPSIWADAKSHTFLNVAFSW